MKRKVTLLILGMLFLLPSILYGDIDTLWTKYFDSDMGTDKGYSVLEAENGDYIFCGVYGLTDLIVGRVDSAGDSIWTNIYSYPMEGSVQGRDIIDIGDGNYVIAGFHIVNLKWDMMLAKINGEGNAIWTRFYDFGADESAYGVCQTRDGGYLIAGRTSSFDAIAFDVFLVKTDSIGEVQGTYLYKSDGGWDAAYGVDTTADGGYIVAC